MTNGLICFRCCHRKLKEVKKQLDPLSGKPRIKDALQNWGIFDWALRSSHTHGYEKDGRGPLGVAAVLLLLLLPPRQVVPPHAQGGLLLQGPSGLNLIRD